MSEITLAEAQQLLWELIAAPEGAASGAAALQRAGRIEDPSLAFLVRETPRMTAVDCVDVYANMYFYRLHDCLRDDFPGLAAELETGRFNDLVTDYLLAHPPRHPSLRELGRALPDFVAGHALGASHPLVPGLARLEWARVDVFDAEDAELLTRDAIIALGSHDPETFRMHAIPALRTFRVPVGVLPRWRRHVEASEEAEPSADPADTVAVRAWRNDFAVWHRSMEADEAACLDRLIAEGVGLGALAETLLTYHEGDEERAMGRLAGLLERWAADGIVTDGPSA
ncbi:MAG: DNA-binding domain-containing protein [Myxococcota bacterium]